ncbi:MAG: inorganic phosphate transporter [candidate division WOR-3 bacterium]
MSYLFLSGGLLLGWSLGANNTADIFGTAIGSKMLKLRTALRIAAIFVILGAVFQGEYTTRNIGELGKINAIGGAFTVCLATALTVIWMTKAGFLVSITQALVGGIVGWTFFAGDFINVSSLSGIIQAWITAPLLGFLIAFILFKILHTKFTKTPINLFFFDFILRICFILVGALAAFSFGANNIANIVGVYVFSNPFPNINVGSLRISSLNILLIVGGISIALGILTGSERVIKTVGEKILKLSPLAGIVVVLSQSLVLLIFSSKIIKDIFALIRIPLPLVPVSSSQVVIGAMIGIGFARGAGRLINFGVLKDIILAWLITPVASAILSFILLFFAQNVFQITVKYPTRFVIDKSVIQKLEYSENLYNQIIKHKNKVYPNGRTFKMELQKIKGMDSKTLNYIIDLSRIDSILVDSTKIKTLPKRWLTPEEVDALKELHGHIYVHLWQFREDIIEKPAFSIYKNTPEKKHELDKKIQLLYHIFRKLYQ